MRRRPSRAIATTTSTGRAGAAPGQGRDDADDASPHLHGTYLGRKNDKIKTYKYKGNKEDRRAWTLDTPSPRQRAARESDDFPVLKRYAVNCRGSPSVTRSRF